MLKCMAKIERFEDLRCWQASRKLVKAIYTICRTGELNKDFDTKSQLKKASLSVMNNRRNTSPNKAYDVASDQEEEYNVILNLPDPFYNKTSEQPKL